MRQFIEEYLPLKMRGKKEGNKKKMHIETHCLVLLRLRHSSSLSLFLFPFPFG